MDCKNEDCIWYREKYETAQKMNDALLEELAEKGYTLVYVNDIGRNTLIKRDDMKTKVPPIKHWRDQAEMYGFFFPEKKREELYKLIQNTKGARYHHAGEEGA